MAGHEAESSAGLGLARPREAARFLGRAVMLHCPHCGGRSVLAHWFRIRVRCPTCGLRLERGEHDYFLGSVLFNYILAGVILIVSLAVTLLVTWPAVPWTLLQYAGPALVIALVVGLFPFSKLIWLSFDLMLRPVTPEELEWHRSAASAYSTEHDPGATPRRPPDAES